jgi:hypothetical protein
VQQGEYREIVEQAVRRAESDAGFRAALIADPVPTIERSFGAAPPGGTDVERLRDGLGAYFGAAGAEGQLSDEQLQAVAGGWSFLDLVKFLWPDKTDGTGDADPQSVVE